MTENKRFKLSYPNGAFLIDGDEPLCHMKNDLRIIDLLNELHEENKEIGNALDDMVTFKNKYRDKYKEVKKENEELKQSNLVLKGKLHRLRMEKGALEEEIECLSEETVEQFKQDLKNEKFIEYTVR